MGIFFSAELPKWMRIRRRLEMIYAGRLGDDWEYDFGVSYKMVPQWAVKTLSWCVYNSNFTSWFMVDIENTTIPTYGFCSPTFNHITNTGGTSARIRICFWEILRSPGFWKLGNDDDGRSPGSNRWRYLLRTIYKAIWIVVIFTEI